jgi:integration host factor subunit alpha
MPLNSLLFQEDSHIFVSGSKGFAMNDTSASGLAQGKTVTRADLSEAVYQKVGLSRTESSALVERVLGEICDSIAGGETVKLSSFGSFVVRDKSERIGRNPKTGIEVPIEPRRVMVFKPSNVLKARVNGLHAADEDE